MRAVIDLTISRTMKFIRRTSKQEGQTYICPALSRKIEIMKLPIQDLKNSRMKEFARETSNWEGRCSNDECTEDIKIFGYMKLLLDEEKISTESECQKDVTSEGQVAAKCKFGIVKKFYHRQRDKNED